MTDRRTLRAWLRSAYPWLDRGDVGPQAVEAGECDRCGAAPRLVPTCGPSGGRALCRDCALTVGDDGWCDGHRREGLAARSWARRLPAEWPTVVRLWWMATGEVRADPAFVALARDELAGRAALPPHGHGYRWADDDPPSSR